MYSEEEGKCGELGARLCMKLWKVEEKYIYVEKVMHELY